MHPKPQIIYLSQIFFVVGPAFILYGYNQAGLSALLDLPDVVRYFPQVDTINTTGAEKVRNSTIKGLVNACLQLGALVGALSCSVIGDSLGRRKSIFIAGLLAPVGQILQCSAFSLAHFIVGRVILGLGIGQLSVTVSVWQSENSSASKRGRQVIAAGIFICVGFASSSWINYGFGKVSFQPVQWRLPLAIPILFSLVICFSVFALPESPHWLVQRNQIESAIDTLAKLNGLPRNNEHVRSEISRIQRSLEVIKGASLRDIFASGKQSRLGYRLVLCIVLQTLQQLVGGNLISIYTTTIFEDNLHLEGDLPQFLAAISLTWKFLCSFIAFAAIDYLGRRVVFIASGTGMSLCMTVMAVATSFPASNQAASIVAAVFIFYV